jgi:hypothetical protein
MPKQLGKLSYPPSAAAPASPYNGQTYYNSTLNHIYGYVNGAWVQLDNDAFSGSLVQSIFKDVTADTTTTSSTYVDLLTQAITTGANFLEFTLTFSATNSTGNKSIDFQILLDAVVVHGGGINVSSAGSSVSGAVSHKAAITAAAHTVKVQWKTTGGTASINATTTPGSYHCSLFIKEVI